MATDVVMPQMGESVAEGTIVRWLKQVGDAVDRDETLLEISTDKVDAEIPSPASGVLLEIRHQAGATVDINTVIAVIGQAADHAKPVPPPPAAAPQPPVAAPQPVEPLARHDQLVAATLRREDGSPQRVSSVARNVAVAHQIDLAQVKGTGIGGRVMKADVLALVDDVRLKPDATKTTPDATKAAPDATKAAPDTTNAAGVGSGFSRIPSANVVPMTVMRKRIAEHMVASKRTSAHVHTVIEVDFTAIEKIRQAKKAEFERQGAKLTYLSFILKATADALKAIPVTNASVADDRITYHPHVHIGIAVALEWGLIVPVIRDVDQKSLLQISAAVADLAGRAREKKLKPEEVGGGTFTVTNPGSFGTLVGFPIINQPQLAILCIGTVEKRVVAVDDALAIRRRAYLTIGYDHRVIDGAVADEFLVHIKHALETWS